MNMDADFMEKLREHRERDEAKQIETKRGYYTEGPCRGMPHVFKANGELVPWFQVEPRRETIRQESYADWNPYDKM